jgi:hypothetical protein
MLIVKCFYIFLRGTLRRAGAAKRAAGRSISKGQAGPGTPRRATVNSARNACESSIVCN